MKSYLGASYMSSAIALVVASCCVLPMAMMLIGLGGSWLAIFGPIAGASLYVLALSTVLVALAVLVAYWRGSLDQLRWGLVGTAAMTMIAWLVLLNEARINDYLISLM